MNCEKHPETKLHHLIEDYGNSGKLEYDFCYSCQTKYNVKWTFNNVPDFTDEQLAWLRDLLTPRCCHISGMHDPVHYTEKKYVCESQKNGCYDRIREALNFGKVTPEEAIPRLNCPMCNR